jgi:hypothetical protein
VVRAWLTPYPAAVSQYGINETASNMNLLGETFLGIPFLFWGVGCLVIAAAFAVAWPRTKVIQPEGWRYLILRWGHSLVWVFLGLSCLIRVLGSSGVADVVAFLALPTYATFLFMLM